METELFDKTTTVSNHQHRFIGQIPEEWRIEKLIHLAEITQGVSKGRDFEGKKVVCAPYLRVANVLDGEFDLSEIKDIELLESEYERYLVRKNDILITEGGDPDKLGRGGIWKGDIEGLVYQNHLFRIRCNEAVLLPDFLSQYIQGRAAKNYFLACAKQTTGIASINMGQIKITPVPVPPIDEQQRILNVLTAHDRVLQTARQLLNAKQQRKRALMQQLLTGQKRLAGFSGEWREVKLGEIFRERKDTKKSHLPLLAITAMNGVVKRDTLEKRDTSNEDKSKYLRICPGDIGYNTMRMWQGVSGVSSHEGLISPAYTVLIPDKSVDVCYMGYLFKFPPMVHLFWRYSQGLVDDTLNCKYDSFRRIPVIIPFPDEQQAIAAVLDSADDEIRLAKVEVEALSRQKRGLMQQLLTGKTRVRLQTTGTIL